MSDKILESVKKVLNIATDLDVFDQDIIMHVNSALSTLNQLGIGPAQGFAIEDDEDTWTAFLDGDPRLNNVKSYVYLRTRLLFDPPQTSFAIEAIKDQIKELEWRLNVVREDDQWSEPVPPQTPVEEIL